jgi:hypothetical protein
MRYSRLFRLFDSNIGPTVQRQSRKMEELSHETLFCQSISFKILKCDCYFIVY